jgi:N-acetylneuraminic acid mutarotase
VAVRAPRFSRPAAVITQLTTLGRPRALPQAPGARSSHTAVWTGTEMIVWGGSGLNSPWINTGGRYNPSTNGWTPTSTTNAPIARSSHVAVWSGQLMIVWGGATATFDTRTGGRYDPATNTWSATSLVNAPSERDLPAAIWTGDKMLIWGGQTFDGTLAIITPAAFMIPQPMPG